MMSQICPLTIELILYMKISEATAIEPCSLRNLPSQSIPRLSKLCESSYRLFSNVCSLHDGACLLKQLYVRNRWTTRILLDYVHKTMKLLTRNRSLFSWKVNVNRLAQNDWSDELFLDDDLIQFSNKLKLVAYLSKSWYFSYLITVPS